MSDADPSAGALIVGAGPTGLTLAHELLRQGVRVRVIDKEHSPSANAKALGVWTRTLELFGRTETGVADEMIKRGTRTPAFHVWSSGKRLVRLDFAEQIDAEYPFILMIPQPETEAILTEQVRRLGGFVERGTELIALNQRGNGAGDGVDVVLRHADGREEQARADWLIGCDGAHSTVRSLLGVPFAGRAFEQSFVTGNVRVRWDLAPDEAHAFLDRGNFIAFFPMPDPGAYRIVIAYQPGQAPAGEVTLEEIQQGISDYGPPGARASEPVRLARFLVDQRKVGQYVSGRVILAGDAAHIHTFIGAQGMNTGIQDAFNLAWKLALVMKGRAVPRLLDSYQHEREGVSKALLTATGRATRFALMRNPLLTTIRDLLVPRVMALTSPRRRIANSLAELRIAYHDSPIVRNGPGGRSGRQAGDRAPDGPVLDAGGRPRRLFEFLSGTRHTMLVFSPPGTATGPPPIDAELAGTYQITRDGADRGGLVDRDGALARRYGLARGGLVLIRPDGYIGLRSHQIAAGPVGRYLDDIGWTGRRGDGR